MPWRLRIGVCALAALALLPVALLAFRPDRAPHAALAATTPADGTILAEPPRAVDLAFTAAVAPDLSHVDVRDASGTAANAGRPTLVRPEILRQPVDIAADGDVTVTYHVILVDGTAVAGAVRFTVGAGAGASAAAARRTAAPSGPAASAPPVEAASHGHGVDPVSAALLALDGLVGLAVIVLLARRPPSRPRAAGRQHHPRRWLPPPRPSGH